MMNKDKLNEWIDNLIAQAEQSDKYFIERNELFLRVDKAIQYIEHRKFIKEQVIMKRDYALQDFEVRKLLEILKGEDNGGKR